MAKAKQGGARHVDHRLANHSVTAPTANTTEQLHADAGVAGTAPFAGPAASGLTADVERRRDAALRNPASAGRQRRNASARGALRIIRWIVERGNNGEQVSHERSERRA